MLWPRFLRGRGLSRGSVVEPSTVAMSAAAASAPANQAQSSVDTAGIPINTPMNNWSRSRQISLRFKKYLYWALGILVIIIALMTMAEVQTNPAPTTVTSVFQAIINSIKKIYGICVAIYLWMKANPTAFWVILSLIVGVWLYSNVSIAKGGAGVTPERARLILENSVIVGIVLQVYVKWAVLLLPSIHETLTLLIWGFVAAFVGAYVGQCRYEAKTPSLGDFR